jgi:hypothetical protein
MRKQLQGDIRGSKLCVQEQESKSQLEKTKQKSGLNVVANERGMLAASVQIVSWLCLLSLHHPFLLYDRMIFCTEAVTSLMCALGAGVTTVVIRELLVCWKFLGKPVLMGRTTGRFTCLPCATHYVPLTLNRDIMYAVTAAMCDHEVRRHSEMQDLLSQSHCLQLSWNGRKVNPCVFKLSVPLC